jgi:hypothetical protein
VRSEMTGVAGFKDWWLSYDHIDIYIHFFGGFWSHGGYAHANHGALRLKGWISWFRGTLFSDKPIYIYTYIYMHIICNHVYIILHVHRIQRNKQDKFAVGVKPSSSHGLGLEQENLLCSSRHYGREEIRWVESTPTQRSWSGSFQNIFRTKKEHLNL